MRTSSTTMKIWDIRQTASTLGLDASHIMPFVQAISGCDKTSPMFGMDQSLFKILNEIRLREHACDDVHECSSQDEIVQSCDEVTASLYGGIIYEGLDFLRYRKFTRKVSASPSLPLHPQQQVTMVNVLICNINNGQKQQIITTF